jgi:hypothetical protein
MKKIMQQQMQAGQAQAQPQPAQGQQAPGQPDVRELQTQIQYPDYQQVIQNQLPNVLQNAPHLESAIRNSDNPYLTAYTLAKQFGGQQPQGQPQPAQGQQAPQGQQQAQRIMQNLSTPGTAGQAGGGGAIGQAGYYAQMDDQTLEAEIAKAKRG